MRLIGSRKPEMASSCKHYSRLKSERSSQRYLNRLDIKRCTHPPLKRKPSEVIEAVLIACRVFSSNGRLSKFCYCFLNPPRNLHQLQPSKRILYRL